MQTKLRVNSVVLVALAGLFVFAVYKLSRLRVSPFGLDPCDAVLHFAVFTVVIALIGSSRALLPHLGHLSPTGQDTHILRSQQAVALAVLIAFSAYALALARHPSAWVSAESRTPLMVWLGVFLTVAGAMEWSVLRARPSRHPSTRSHRGPAVLACLSAFAALVFCPEYGGGPADETAHILTVMLGCLIVLIPVAYLLPFLVPSERGEQRGDKLFFGTSGERGALVSGILLGAFFFWVDAHRTEATQSLVRFLTLISPVLGLLIVYAFLAERLGLDIRHDAK